MEFAIGILILEESSLLNQIHAGLDHIIAGSTEEALAITWISMGIQINAQNS
tara:strand:+ start:31 stop:186 length:156 start_codon:yes stop_codon:yes gene_type:complete